MNNKFEIPMGMLVRKFYCPACGERLIKSPKTRIIRRADHDYRKYRRIRHTRLIGDVKLTEYDFKCPCCGKIPSYEDQCVIETIQKNIGKKILSEAEIAEHTQKAKADLKEFWTDTDGQVLLGAAMGLAVIIFGYLLMTQINF